MKSDLHDVDVIYQTETEKAVCVRADANSPDVWIPKSQCEFSRKGSLPISRGCVVTLTAPEPLLTDKGLV